MSPRTLFLLLVAALLALFTIFNWQAFTTPTTLFALLLYVFATRMLIGLW